MIEWMSLYLATLPVICHYLCLVLLRQEAGWKFLVGQMDTKIKVCRICLNTDVKLFYIDNVIEYYISLLASDECCKSFPNYICYECASLLMKFIKFRKKYIAAQSILSNMIKEHGEIKEQDIKGLKSSTFILKSPLGHRKLPPISMGKNTIMTADVIVHKEHTPDYEIKPDVYIKPDIDETEADDDEQAVAEEEIEFNIDIKPEVDDNELEDESRAVPSTAKIKVEKIGNTIVEDQSDDDLPITSSIVSKRKEDKTDSHSEAAEEVQKRKRRRTIKVAAPSKAKKRKPKRTKNTSNTSDNDTDLSKYVTIVKLSKEEQLEELKKRQQSSNYMNTPYQCNLCYRGFIHTHAWKHHLLKHDPSAGDLECPICKIRFKEHRLLRDHAKRNHQMKYICKSCPYISRREVQARLHQKWHDGVTYKCQYCDEICTKWTSYLSHVRIKHPSEFICDVCGCSFISRLGLGMHKNKMHKNVTKASDGKTEPGPYCKECDIKFVSVEAWNRHMVISSKHKQTAHFKNLCRVCGRTFKCTEELQVHHKEEHAPKPLKRYPYPKFRTAITWPLNCEHCTKEIPNARQYWAHYRQMHPNENYPLQRNHEYICDICGKRFPTNTVLVYHKHTHSEERQFKCGTCGKAFHNRANLQTHETQTHSDLRPFPCALCNKAFKCKGALSRHSRCHTGAKPYTCELCGKSFSQSNSRKLHVSTVHLKQPAPPRARRRPASGHAPPTPPTPHATAAGNNADTDDTADTEHHI